MNRLMQKMVPVIDKYAKENGFGLLIDASNPQSPLVWAAPSVDVSKAIVDAYNAQSGVAPPPSAPSGAAKSAPGATTRPATTTPAAKPATPPKPQ
jgi:outer membrane protein